MKLWFTKGVWLSKTARQKLTELSVNDVKSIAVIRHGALGDMILTRAFLIEARKVFPNAKITLSIVSNYTRGTPADLVDRVHVIHGSDQRGTPMGERIKRIKELGYHDIIFDLASSSRSVMTCLLNKAKLKVGFPYRALQARLFYDIATCRSDLNFEVNDMISMLHVFGARTRYPHVYAMPGAAVVRNQPYVIYFAGASTLAKCWPADHFTALIQDLATRYPQFEHLVLEGIQSWEKADSILAPITHLKNTGAITANTIEDTTALLKGAALVVSNDTGIRHIAIACSTPTVGIFFADPYRYWPRYPIHDVVLPDPAWPPAVKNVKAACVTQLDNTGRERS
jgi:ADP-heptose:LPS heptosyltransferase